MMSKIISLIISFPSFISPLPSPFKFKVITFLLNTEIIPLCLRIMERGSELSKTVATFIVQRILLDDSGLQYICNTAERFYAVRIIIK